MPLRIEQWKAHDDTLHATKEEATEHENILAVASEWVKLKPVVKITESYLIDGRPNGIPRDVEVSMQAAVDMLTVLSKFVRFEWKITEE